MGRLKPFEKLTYPCYDVWYGPCDGWSTREPHQYHGCKLAGNHQGPHVCKCGSETTKTLPPPKGPTR